MEWIIAAVLLVSAGVLAAISARLATERRRRMDADPDGSPDRAILALVLLVVAAASAATGSTLLAAGAGWGVQVAGYLAGILAVGLPLGIVWWFRGGAGRRR